MLATLNNLSPDQLASLLGNAVFDADTGLLVSAEALAVTYLNVNMEMVEDGSEVDPVNEAWEEQVFLDAAEDVPSNYQTIDVNYLATRSFADEFGATISGDILLVQVSYFVAFIFL